MVRVSKTLLCALAARVGLATRQNVKLDRMGSVANVVEKIGALIQAQGESAAHSKAIDNIRMLAAITPEANELLTESLTNVINEIEKNVDAKIIAGFAATQKAVVTTIENLDTATQSALEYKKAADIADTTWFECVGVESSTRVAVEAAVAAEDAANKATVVPCQQQVNRTKFESDPKVDNSFRFTCDYSIKDDCQNKQQAYDLMVSGIVSKLKTEAQQATDFWTEAKTACDAAVATAEAKELARQDADKTWQTQRRTCKNHHEDRQLALCNFGEALQNKCQKFDAYNDLIVKVDMVDGGGHSEADRKLEWKTTQVTKCMLNKVIEGVDLDATSLSACDSVDAVDYDGSVGQLDRKAEQFATLTSPDSFSCSEKTITFNEGETWAVPDGDAPASSSYKKTPFHPDVHLAEETAPFSLCDIAAAAGGSLQG